MQSKLQNKFEGFGAEPSTDVWSGIESRLDEKRRKKRLLFWIPSGIAATLLVLGSLLYMQQGENTALLQKDALNVSSDKSENDDQKSESKSVLPAPVNQDSPAQLQPQKNSYPLLVNWDPSRAYSVGNKTDYALYHKIDSLLRVENKNNQMKLDSLQALLLKKDMNGTDQMKDSLNLSKQEKDSSNRIDSSLGAQNDQAHNATTRKPWLIRANIGTWNSFQNRDQDLKSGFSSLNSADPLLEQNTTNSNINSLESIALPNSRVSVEKPLTISVQVAKPFSKRWTWFAGLNYDRLISENKNNNNFTNCAYNSFGLNLGMEYRFLSINRFSMSSSLLLNNDMFLFKSTKTNLSSAYAASGQEGVKGFQNSVQLDLNFNFQVGKRAAISLKPAVRQYLFQEVNSTNFVLKRNFWYGASVGYTWSF